VPYLGRKGTAVNDKKKKGKKEDKKKGTNHDVK
jgi:hypothetical protein